LQLEGLVIKQELIFLPDWLTVIALCSSIKLLFTSFPAPSFLCSSSWDHSQNLPIYRHRRLWGWCLPLVQRQSPGANPLWT
jgi:hypothetical protein